MEAFEIRLIGYIALGLMLMGGAGWCGYKITSMHYESLMAKDEIAQYKIVQDAQASLIALERERDNLKQQVEKDHAAMVQADTASRNAILDSVRGLETALHIGAMSRPVDNSAKSGGTGP